MNDLEKAWEVAEKLDLEAAKEVLRKEFTEEEIAKMDEATIFTIAIDNLDEDSYF